MTIGGAALCASCGKPLDNPVFCASCRALQPEASSIDPFRRLGLEPRFAIDAADLESRFLAHSRVLHPDRFTNRPEPERAASLRLSAALNDAVAILRDPLKRADLVLVHLGGPPSSDRRTPAGFVESMLEAREAVEEAKAAGDRAALARVRESVSARRESLLREIGERFGKLESLSPGAAFDATAREIRDLLNAGPYLATLLREAADC
jgi:molecular chaperone HscB